MLPVGGKNKRCCWGLCKSDSRYPKRLPEGTYFLPFPKPARIRPNMTERERKHAQNKCDKARRWLELCGRTDFHSPEQIGTSFICSLHFTGGKGPRSDNDEPVQSKPLVQRKKRGTAPAPGADPKNTEKKRCLKRMRDEEKVAKQKLENMISGSNFDIGDLQVQQVQLLKAFAEMQSEADRLRSENQRLRDALQSDFSKLSYRFLRCDEEQLHFLSGLPVAAFEWLAPQMARTIFRVHPEVSPQDHLLMVLMKLKLGLSDRDLGYRFQMDGGIVTAVCQTWVPVLAAVVSPLIVWPSPGAVSKTRPCFFTNRTKRCRCIVDTLEVTIATPAAAAKAVSYVVGLTPAGALCFVSPGFFCKKKTDKQLMRESGLMELLKPRDLLLSNKNFPIDKELGVIGARLLSTASDSARDVSGTVRLHMDQVSSWWKDFGMFHTAIPEVYDEMLDDVVVACAALTNLRMSLTPVRRENQEL